MHQCKSMCGRNPFFVLLAGVALVLAAVLAIVAPSKSFAQTVETELDKEKVAEGYVAKYGDNYVKTLYYAFYFCDDGDTVTLLTDCSSDSAQIAYLGFDNQVGKSYTLDLNGHTLESSSYGYAVSIMCNDVSLTITNGTIKNTDDSIYYCIVTNGTLTGVDITLDGVTVENSANTQYEGRPAAYGMYIPSDGTVTIKNSNVYGTACGIEQRRGDLIIDNSTVGCSDEIEPGTSGNNSGTTSWGAAIAFAPYSAETPIAAKITNTTIDGAMMDSNPNGVDDATMSYDLSGNTYNGEIKSELATGFIEDGTFAIAPAKELLADGFDPIETADGTYVVESDHAFGDAAVSWDDESGLKGTASVTCATCGTVRTSNITTSGMSASAATISDIVANNDLAKSAILNGKDLVLMATAEECDADADTIKLVEGVLDENETPIHYYDVKLSLSNGDESCAINETAEPVSVYVGSGSDIAPADDPYTYRIIRVHEGVASEVDGDYNAATESLTIRSDRFSTYAVVAKPVAKNSDVKPTDNANDKDAAKKNIQSDNTGKADAQKTLPDTGDSNASIVAVSAVAICGISVIAVGVEMRRRAANRG